MSGTFFLPPCLTTYNYDANGNLSSKVAPQPNQNASCGNTVTTSYGYDALNRVLYKDYNPDTTTVRAAYAYDGYGWAGPNQGFPNSVGHLTASWSVLHDGTVVAANETNYFDPMGRPQQGRECTPATCGLTSGVTNYPWVAGYDFLGNETSLWESSLARYTPLDAVSRLSAMTASPAAPQPSPPLTGTSTGPGTQLLINISAHSPFGGLTSAALGNGLAETRNYTNRGWPGSMWVGSVYTLSMGYAGNGNVTGAIDSENGNSTYSYDTLNRLQTAVIGGQTFTYSPDAYGNMTCTAPQGVACTPLGLNISAATNQITTSGYTYDAAGNLLTDNTHGYVYDAENRLICVLGLDGTCNSASAMLYLYDAQGQRVGKQQADTLEDYVYDPQGHIVSMHDGSANLLRTELYSPEGRHMATWAGSNWSTSNLVFNHADWLGTERVRTNSGGTGGPAAVEWCTDTPYGMNLNCVTTQGDISPSHFTGKQRDPETASPTGGFNGLDYFGARYNASTIGRFMSADPLGRVAADPSDPQTWNMYAYVRNNPTSKIDPDGTKCIALDGGGQGDDGTGGGCAAAGVGPNGENQAQTVTVTATASDIPLEAVAPLLVGGHHWFPQQFLKNLPLDSPAYRAFANWVSGPLKDKSINYFDQLHRDYNAQIGRIIRQYLTDVGEGELKDLSKEQVKELGDLITKSGGKVAEFYERMKPEIEAAEGDMEQAWEEIKPLLDEPPPI